MRGNFARNRGYGTCAESPEPIYRETASKLSRSSMLRWRLPIVGLLIATAASAQVTSEWTLSPARFGPVKIGTTLPQLSKLLGEDFEPPENMQNKDRQRCFDVTPAKSPHVSFMIEDGRLARIDIDAPGISTAAGVQVGDSEESAFKAYQGRLKVEPMHDGGPGSHYLTLRENSNGLRFETDHGKVEAMYAGRFEAIIYDTGCE